MHALKEELGVIKDKVKIAEENQKDHGVPGAKLWTIVLEDRKHNNKELLELSQRTTRLEGLVVKLDEKIKKIKEKQE